MHKYVRAARRAILYQAQAVKTMSIACARVCCLLCGALLYASSSCLQCSACLQASKVDVPLPISKAEQGGISTSALGSTALDTLGRGIRHQRIRRRLDLYSYNQHKISIDDTGKMAEYISTRYASSRASTQLADLLRDRASSTKTSGGYTVTFSRVRIPDINERITTEEQLFSADPTVTVQTPMVDVLKKVIDGSIKLGDVAAEGVLGDWDPLDGDY